MPGGRSRLHNAGDARWTVSWPAFRPPGLHRERDRAARISVAAAPFNAGIREFIMAISTRLHGWIDYAAAVSLGSLAFAGPLSGPARRVAAVATAVPVCAFLLTDFEAGLVGLIGVRRHLRFDVAEGLLLFAVGAAMRRQPGTSRGILAFYGLAQLVLGLTTSETAKSGPGQGSGPIGRLLGSP